MILHNETLNNRLSPCSCRVSFFKRAEYPKDDMNNRSTNCIVSFCFRLWHVTLIIKRGCIVNGGVLFPAAAGGQTRPSMHAFLPLHSPDNTIMVLRPQLQSCLLQTPCPARLPLISTLYKVIASQLPPYQKLQDLSVKETQQ